jgi:hypothetical protein
MADLQYKLAESRSAEQYNYLRPDTVLAFGEAVTAYRIITGACKFGTEQVIKSLKSVKENYTVAEMIELTAGQYGAKTFRKFIEKVSG